MKLLLLVASLSLFLGPVSGRTVDAASASPLLTTPSSPGPDRHHVLLLEQGYDALLVRVHLIRQAQVSIDLQTFIWTNDECGRLLMFELLQAARRGVRVRILADHMFSDQDADTVAYLASAHPNLALKHYRPARQRIKPSLAQTLFAGLRSFHAVNQRMHNKVMLVDGRLIITGGRNIENTYFDHALGLNFRDRDVLALGPAAADATASFEQFWNYRHSVASQDLVDVAAALAAGAFRRYDTRADWDFGSYFQALEREADDAALITERFVQPLRVVEDVQFIADDPGKSRGFWSKTARLTRELRGLLLSAEESLVIQTPYLVLSPPARRLLRELQRERPELRVRISTNSLASTDNLLAYSANYRLRNVYVEQLNLHVYEFMPRPGLLREHLPSVDELQRLAELRRAQGQPAAAPYLCLHAKSLVVDDRLAFIGSYNLDPRSENLNTEVGLLIRDAALARELRATIEADLRPENSWVIGRRPLPLQLDVVNGLIDGLLSLTPLDVWPIQNTTSYELRPGAEVVAPDHPRFHAHYRDVGSFPGTDGPLSSKELLTRLYKAVGTPLTPIL